MLQVVKSDCFTVATRIMLKVNFFFRARNAIYHFGTTFSRNMFVLLMLFLGFWSCWGCVCFQSLLNLQNCVIQLCPYPQRVCESLCLLLLKFSKHVLSMSAAAHCVDVGLIAEWLKRNWCPKSTVQQPRVKNVLDSYAFLGLIDLACWNRADLDQTRR